MNEGIEVYQDMNVRIDKAKRPAFRELLISGDNPPWKYDAERSDSANEFGGDEEALAFVREESQGLRAAGLLLWENDEGYAVTNIVPEKSGKLSSAEYNAILADFVSRVAGPAVALTASEIACSRPVQDLEDWMSEGSAEALRRFSRSANKSTGASHPLDERRWFDFIVAVHRTGRTPGTDMLSRWLVEVEGWDEDAAYDLAGEFERGVALLAHYDGN